VLILKVGAGYPQQATGKVERDVNWRMRGNQYN
jgi:hypothetical protein